MSVGSYSPLSLAQAHPRPCHGVWEDIQDRSHVSNQMVQGLCLPQPGSSGAWLKPGSCLMVSEV